MEFKIKDIQESLGWEIRKYQKIGLQFMMSESPAF